jgi:F-type H+-transporting ATPase subunit epsilon
MRLKVLLPAEILVDEPVEKIIAEAENGSFCLLPRHIDFVAALVPGILQFVGAGGREEFLAVDEGILVKCAEQVLVSVRNGIRGASLGDLRLTVEQHFKKLDEQQKKHRATMARLEVGFVRQFIQLEENSHG